MPVTGRPGDPWIAEPLFMDLDAAVEFVPATNGGDLKRALDGLRT